MDNLWYEKQFEVGPNGEKVSLLMIDSSLLICESFLSASKEEKEMMLNHLDYETQNL
jgi:hypothetical protein